ncbi:MAG: prenyltransferase [Marinilabiliales bacterium]|nr:MAG: prenyltransferase [Marinilabiliales bacterium]
MEAYLRLIRYKNLLIVAATQYLMRFAIVEPLLAVNGFELQLDGFHFFLLVLATIMITAAGYVINDYFDTRTDMLNRPGTVVIGRYIGRRTAIILHWVLNFAGVAAGFYLAFHIGIPLLGFFFIMVAGLLWFYSTTYNRRFLVGNIIIASLTAMVPVMVVIFEIPMLSREYTEIPGFYHPGFSHIFAWVASFGYFAFMTTMIRELVKDIEDFEGDTEQGRRSVPIVLGKGNTRIIIGALILLVIASLAFLYYVYLRIGFSGNIDYLSLIWFLLFLFLPLMLLLYRVIRAKTREDYTFANHLSKIIMLMGLLYSLLVRYIVLKGF